MSFRARNPLRRIAETCLLTAVLFLLTGTWLIDARIVVSGSMAPALLGPHWKLTCRNCGHSFAVADDGQDADLRRAVCGNCGSAEPLADARRAAGDRVLIDRSAFLFRPPRRWEVVALHPPHAPQDVVIKRAVGLPGETIEIRGGDVFVDGRMLRKSIAELAALAVPVHDDRFRPAGSGAPRWRGGPDSHWRATPQGYACEAPDDTAAPDWLEYHHLPGADGDRAFVDSAAYNQLIPRRFEDFRPAAELLLSCRLHVTGEAVLRICDGRWLFEVHLRADEGRATAHQKGRELAVAIIPPGTLSAGAETEIAVCDGRLLMSIDGGAIFACDGQGQQDQGERAAAGVAIGAVAGRVEVESLVLRRDVYCTRPQAGPRSGDQKVCRLGTDEYFVLGDNSPHSADSRGWHEQPTSQLLLGKPFMVYFPSRGRGRGGGIQVPDWENIRYIR